MSHSQLTLDQLWFNFSQYDKDGSGSITILELKDILNKQQKTPITEDALNYLVKKYDSNSDGLIDFGEFVVFLTGAPYLGPLDLKNYKPGSAQGAERVTGAQKTGAQQGQVTGQGALSFQQEFHKGFLEGYSQGYNQGLQKFLAQGPRAPLLTGSFPAPVQSPAPVCPPQQAGAAGQAPVVAPQQAQGAPQQGQAAGSWQQNVARHLEQNIRGPAPVQGQAGVQVPQPQAR